MNRAFLLLAVGTLVVFLVLAGLGLARGAGGAHLSLDPLFQPGFVTPSLIFGALSLAVISFLGFDAVSTLAEEAKGGARDIGRATLISLILAALLFVLETYLASLFILGHPPFAAGDEAATAYMVISEILGGPAFMIGLTITGAMGGLAGALVAQAATGRILYGMARDGQLPRILAHVSGRTQSPDRAILLVGGVTLVTALAFEEQLQFITSIVTFGALVGFLALHASVVIHFRGGARSGQLLRHLVAPLVGAAIVGYVLWNAGTSAKLGGLAWLGLGVCLAVYLKLRGRTLAIPVAEP